MFPNGGSSVPAVNPVGSNLEPIAKAIQLVHLVLETNLSTESVYIEVCVTYTGATVMSVFKTTLALAAVTSRQIHTLSMSPTGAQTFCTLIHI